MTDAPTLRLLLHQTTRAGTQRRAAILHTDRLPPAFARPHHIRLAREALGSLAAADRAQSFDLPRGRIAIVWRGAGDHELAQARKALDQLLAGQRDAPAAGDLLTLYDLPAQVAWLLDEVAAGELPPARPDQTSRLDATALAVLEAKLAAADLSGYTRWRPVMRLGPAAPGLAWEERLFAIQDIAATLAPGHDLRADPWLFARLTRTLDRKMLDLLIEPYGLRGRGAFAINLNVEAILSPGFMAFDNALPIALRGDVIINLTAADLLSDPDSFTFARRFANARGYRLALTKANPALLDLLNLRAANLDYIHLACTPDMMKADTLPDVPAGTNIVLTALHTQAALEWASSHASLGAGRALIG